MDIGGELEETVKVILGFKDSLGILWELISPTWIDFLKGCIDLQRDITRPYYFKGCFCDTV